MNLVDAAWYLARGTGTAALVMFTTTLVLGIVTRSGRRLPGLDRYGVADLHRTAALTGTGLVLVHLVSLLVDPYAQLRLLDVVLPFGAGYRPVWVGLGTAALDVLVVLVGCSLLRHRVGPRVFRAVHWASYALWPLALAHGLGSGTDAGTGWFRLVALACAAAVTAALGWRLAASYEGRGRQRLPRRPLTRAVPR